MTLQEFEDWFKWHAEQVGKPPNDAQSDALTRWVGDLRRLSNIQNPTTRKHAALAKTFAKTRGK